MVSFCRQGVVFIVYGEVMDTCKRAMSSIYQVRSHIYVLTSVTSGVIANMCGAVNVDLRFFGVDGTCRQTDVTVSCLVACENMQWQSEPLDQD